MLLARLVVGAVEDSKSSNIAVLLLPDATVVSCPSGSVYSPVTAFPLPPYSSVKSPGRTQVSPSLQAPVGEQDWDSRDLPVVSSKHIRASSSSSM